MLASTEEETAEFGAKFAKKLEMGDIVALHGDLGAGKTTLAKAIVSQIAGVSKREVQSPTFTYLNIYDTTLPIYHFDLYRLKNEEAFIQLGFLDYLEEEGICLIEWAERIEPLLPQKTIHVRLSYVEEGKRKIDVYQS